MKQANDKYTVAWFKIADCVSRGEKERALGVYRLLSHSIESLAVRAQLHGDILYSFKDKSAATEYKKAAELFIKEEKLLDAAQVFEHILFLDPQDERSRKDLVDVYMKLDNDALAKEHAKKIKQS